jgi:pimeloyl-ACP methyl ester carboxylesterase
MGKIRYFILTKSVGAYINLMSYWNPVKASLLAYQLFSNPRVGKLSAENMPTVLKEATRETFHHNGLHFETYKWHGNENVTLLVHGWESNASRWEKLLPYLKKSGNTIIAIDAPAHGLSGGTEFNVPQYAEFIDVLVQMHKPKHIIGHSIGGIASAYYQHHYSNHQLEKMVLLGAPSDFKILIENYVKMLGLNANIHQFLIRYTKERFQIDIEDFSGQKFLMASTIPGIIAHDHEDSVVAFSEGKKLASSWKTAEFIETKGLGHSMHDDELYEKIIRFLIQ